MCGIVGYIGSQGDLVTSPTVINEMMAKVMHRGPDSSGVFLQGEVAIGFRRLALVGIDDGDQPLRNEDGSLVLCCNGEIFNYKEILQELIKRGHQLSTKSDVEVIVHLYEEYGPDLVKFLNGQFAFVLYDRVRRLLMIARDHSGIVPIYYAIRNGGIIFGSEIKAILSHPEMGEAAFNMVGLDQIICFPGTISPTTMFEGVDALPPGSLLTWSDSKFSVHKYSDINYPIEGDLQVKSEDDYANDLSEIFKNSVHRRLQAEVPVGIYLSGGLDSSMIACMAAKLSEERLSTFSVTFADRKYSEERYQKLVVDKIRSKHHEFRFESHHVIDNFERMIYHSECPVKESYNICSMLLSDLVRQCGVKAILTGEGADELFAGYSSYKFAAMRARMSRTTSEDEVNQRLRLWGIDFEYEKNYSLFSNKRMRLYSKMAKEIVKYRNALSFRLVDYNRLKNRHEIHQRSYVDCKLRLADHLLVEHGDKMLLSNSVEGRYPFLDRDLVELAQKIPPEFKLRGFNEKFILKRIAANFVPTEIVRREKYGFHAPASSTLLSVAGDWVRDILSPDRIVRQGCFDPQVVSGLLTEYSQPGFVIDARVDDDLLMVVLSSSIFFDIFGIASL